MLNEYAITLVAGIGLGVFIVSHVVAYLRSPLKDVPGPFLAKFTNVWRLINHYKATQISTQQRLHKELGPAVRIGPNTVSLSDPTLLRTVYSTRGEYIKVSHPWSQLRRHSRLKETSWTTLSSSVMATLTGQYRATSIQSMTPYKTAMSSRMSSALGATPFTAGT